MSPTQKAFPALHLTSECYRRTTETVKKGKNITIVQSVPHQICNMEKFERDTRSAGFRRPTTMARKRSSRARNGIHLFENQMELSKFAVRSLQFITVCQYLKKLAFQLTKFHLDTSEAIGRVRNDKQARPSTDQRLRALAANITAYSNARPNAINVE